MVEEDSHITMIEDNNGVNMIGAAQTFRLQQSMNREIYDMAIWNSRDGLIFNRQYQPARVRRHFRVGVINVSFIHIYNFCNSKATSLFNESKFFAFR